MTFAGILNKLDCNEYSNRTYVGKDYTKQDLIDDLTALNRVITSKTTQQ